MAQKNMIRGEEREKKIQALRTMLDASQRIYCIKRRYSNRDAYPTRFYDVYTIDLRPGELPRLWYLNGDLEKLTGAKRNKNNEIVITGGNFSAEQEIADDLSIAIYGERGRLRYESL